MRELETPLTSVYLEPTLGTNTVVSQIRIAKVKVWQPTLRDWGDLVHADLLLPTFSLSSDPQCLFGVVPLKLVVTAPIGIDFAFRFSSFVARMPDAWVEGVQILHHLCTRLPEKGAGCGGHGAGCIVHAEVEG